MEKTQHIASASTPPPVTRVSWRDLVKGDWKVVDTGNDNHVIQQRTIAASSVFAERMRTLVGAEPDSDVTILEEEESVNVYGCDTWESSSGVTVTVGGVEYSFESVPELFTRLQFAGSATTPLAVKEKFLSRLGTVHFVDDAGSAVALYGRVANAGSYRLLIAVPRDQAVALCRGNPAELHMSVAGEGESLLSINGKYLLGFEPDTNQYWCCGCKRVVAGACPDVFYCPQCAEKNRCVECGVPSYTIFSWNEGRCSPCARRETTNG